VSCKEALFREYLFLFVCCLIRNLNFNLGRRINAKNTRFIIIMHDRVKSNYKTHFVRITQKITP
jgi:hypothetical protein